ncbi:hypothetical protein V8E54_015273 [Elaphomyces granulatus]
MLDANTSSGPDHERPGLEKETSEPPHGKLEKADPGPVSACTANIGDRLTVQGRVTAQSSPSREGRPTTREDGRGRDFQSDRVKSMRRQSLLSVALENPFERLPLQPFPSYAANVGSIPPLPFPPEPSVSLHGPFLPTLPTSAQSLHSPILQNETTAPTESLPLPDMRSGSYFFYANRKFLLHSLPSYTGPSQPICLQLRTYLSISNLHLPVGSIPPQPFPPERGPDHERPGLEKETSEPPHGKLEKADPGPVSACTANIGDRLTVQGRVTAQSSPSREGRPTTREDGRGRDFQSDRVKSMRRQSLLSVALENPFERLPLQPFPSYAANVGSIPPLPFPPEPSVSLHGPFLPTLPTSAQSLHSPILQNETTAPTESLPLPDMRSGSYFFYANRKFLLHSLPSYTGPSQPICLQLRTYLSISNLHLPVGSIPPQPFPPERQQSHRVESYKESTTTTSPGILVMERNSEKAGRSRKRCSDRPGRKHEKADHSACMAETQTGKEANMMSAQSLHSPILQNETTAPTESLSLPDMAILESLLLRNHMLSHSAGHAYLAPALSFSSHNQNHAHPKHLAPALTTTSFRTTLSFRSALSNSTLPNPHQETLHLHYR